MKVPEVLLSGDHGKVERWRREEALRQTFLKRPDLIEEADLTEEDKEFLGKLKKRQGKCHGLRQNAECKLKNAK
jgi:tRNA (guanine37-N1)-methyltransferase